MAVLLVSFMVFAPAKSQADGYLGGSIGQSYIELDVGTPSGDVAGSQIEVDATSFERRGSFA